VTSFARRAYNCHWITASSAAGGKYDYRIETSGGKGASIFTTAIQTSIVNTCILNFSKD
jgi:hypothetical protein